MAEATLPTTRPRARVGIRPVLLGVTAIAIAATVAYWALAFRGCYLLIFGIFLLLAPLVPLLRRPGSPGSPSAAR